jgi:cyd operon protein YbgT
MWYFTWILGIGFACSFGILNAIWHELHLPTEKIDE